MPGHGTQRQLAGMLAAAHGHHWDATLCVLRSGDELTQHVRDEGVPTIELGATSDADPRRLGRLHRIVSNGRFDVIHSSLWGTNVVTRAAAVGRRRPAIVVSER